MCFGRSHESKHLRWPKSNLEPSPEFTRLAVEEFETRKLVQSVVEDWKNVLASALTEWARQHVLKMALSAQPAQNQESKEQPKVETTQSELEPFEAIKKLLGPECPIEYEDSVAYFKVHLAGKRTWVFARLQLDRKVPYIWVPLTKEQTESLAPAFQVTVYSGWSVVMLNSTNAISQLSELLRAAYLHVKQSRGVGSNEE